MDAVKYLKEFKRMCDSIDDSDDSYCEGCPLHQYDGRSCNYGWTNEEKVEIVEKWSNEHPIKTRQSEFLKMFPNAEMFEGVLCLDPCTLESNLLRCDIFKGNCEKCRHMYWLEEIE